MDSLVLSLELGQCQNKKENMLMAVQYSLKQKSKSCSFFFFFFFLWFMPHGDLSSLTGDQTCSPAVEVTVLTSGPPENSPVILFLKKKKKILCICRKRVKGMEISWQLRE